MEISGHLVDELPLLLSKIQLLAFDRIARLRHLDLMEDAGEYDPENQDRDHEFDQGETTLPDFLFRCHGPPHIPTIVRNVIGRNSAIPLPLATNCC